MSFSLKYGVVRKSNTQFYFQIVHGALRVSDWKTAVSDCDFDSGWKTANFYMVTLTLTENCELLYGNLEFSSISAGLDINF